MYGVALKNVGHVCHKPDILPSDVGPIHKTFYLTKNMSEDIISNKLCMTIAHFNIMAHKMSDDGLTTIAVTSSVKQCILV